MMDPIFSFQHGNDPRKESWYIWNTEISQTSVVYDDHFTHSGNATKYLMIGIPNALLHIQCNDTVDDIFIILDQND